MSSTLSDLNPSQREAVSHEGGACMVIAGAGSGKTRVLTHRVAYLLEKGVSQREILALTFTNKAAAEMRGRIARLMGDEVKDLWVGTFHAMFCRILRLNAGHLGSTEGFTQGFTQGFTIYDRFDSESALKRIMKELSLDYPVGRVARAISSAKNNAMSATDYLAYEEQHPSSISISEIYTHYAGRCKSANAMDFDDLLYQTYVLFTQNPQILDTYVSRFTHVLVDEFQDTNMLQYQLLRLLTERKGNLYVVGDDAQSIYSFRGATIENIFRFQKDYADHVLHRLEQNYRSSQCIIASANAVIQNNKNQIQKRLWTENPQGVALVIEQAMHEEDEGKIIASHVFGGRHNYGLSYSDIAILYRTHKQSRAIEDALSRVGVPYRIYGGLSFYDRKEIKDVLSYLRFIANGSDEVAFRRIVNVPRRRIGPATVNSVMEVAVRERISVWEVLCSRKAFLRPRLADLLTPFVDIIAYFKDLSGKKDVYALSKSLISHSGLSEEWAGDEVAGESKKENVEELLSGIQGFVDRSLAEKEGDSHLSLSEFLESTALSASSDTQGEEDVVSVMTVHNAKGLEFKQVVVAGLERELFPSGRAEEIEEERRLFYVALTRARERLVLTYALSRYQYGEIKSRFASPFLGELPEQFLQSTFRARHKETFRSSKNVRPLRRMEGDVGGQDASFLEIIEGMRVKHTIFGEGEVLRVDRGQSPKACVRFDSGAEKILLLHYAKLLPV